MKWALLEEVPEDSVRALLSIARRRKFGRGEVVFRQEDPRTPCIWWTGADLPQVQTQLGDTAILAVLGPGDMFGELALLGDDEDRRSATVAALEAGETRSVHRLDFERLRPEHPETSAVLIALSGPGTPVAPPAGGPLRLGRQAGPAATGRGGAGIQQRRRSPDLQEDLAGLAGTSRATVNQVLRDEEDRGTVKLARGRTSVLDPDELARRGR